MALQDEINWFESNRAYIAQQYQGQWVLVSGQTVRGSYPSYEAAYVAGTQMFGQQPFLVKQALATEKVNRI